MTGSITRAAATNEVCLLHANTEHNDEGSSGSKNAMCEDDLKEEESQKTQSSNSDHSKASSFFFDEDEFGQDEGCDEEEVNWRARGKNPQTRWTAIEKLEQHRRYYGERLEGSSLRGLPDAKRLRIKPARAKRAWLETEAREETVEKEMQQQRKQDLKYVRQKAQEGRKKGTSGRCSEPAVVPSSS
jgi:hypothetical protein